MIKLKNSIGHLVYRTNVMGGFTGIILLIISNLWNLTHKR